MYKMPMKPSWW